MATKHVRKTWILPQDAAKYVWNWGNSFCLNVLGIFFNKSVHIYSDEEYRMPTSSHIGSFYDAYWGSPHSVEKRKQICREIIEDNDPLADSSFGITKEMGKQLKSKLSDPNIE